MAFCPFAFVSAGYTGGCFNEVEFGNFFEFRNLSEDEFQPFDNYKQVVYTTNHGDGNPRYARVLKTVAYVVVNEDADGQPIVEKWSIRSYREYASKYGAL